MSGQLFSPAWYRVADQRPRLRRHVVLDRHRYRGRRWYLLSDPVSGKHFRLNEAAWALVGRFDGQRALQRLWHEVCEALGDAAPTQDEVIRLLGRLHQADLVQMPDPPQLPELQRRKGRQRRSRWLQYLRSPLSIKIPLWDPDVFLARTLSWVAPIFSRWGLLIWLLLIGSALVIGVQHFDTLREGWQDQLFSLQGATMLAVLYPLVKLLHELSHGWAVKRWGGEVHELGIMLLVLMPVPYVDASASTRFEQPVRRMAVAAAGVCAELGIAAFAMWFWVLAEPGLARAMAWQLILIGMVSSLLVNGNPLLKFDAYYVLADALGIPNLAKRANDYVAWLVHHYLLGDRSAEPVVQAPGEAGWLLAYALLSFVYRTALVIGILWFISSRFFTVGIVLAFWAFVGTLLVPSITKFWRLTRTLSLRRCRLRGSGLMLGALVLLWTGIAWVPLPHNLLVEGVAWVPENARLRVAEPCLVEKIVAKPGQRLQPGDPVLRCANPELVARLRVAEARLAKARARLDASGSDRVEREIARQSLVFAEDEVEHLRERVLALTLRAHRTGRLILQRATDLPGMLLARGEAVGWLLMPGALVVRSFIDQATWDLLQQAPYKVSARRASRIEEELVAQPGRLIPGATRTLPSRVLGISGGGPWPELPESNPSVISEPTSPRTLRPGFILDLLLPEGRLQWPEERVYLRFTLAPEPLLPRLRRRLHELFLRHFDA